ncbi:uncharacterized protein LOC112047302 isoform X2 [Bicyclus anynana]|uniref:Uncharacterized protein LOC112047302 isoform X2 n=1 Tax=Bicyclus anynana TaxID=110368 RepID=A0ABM3M7Y7_BICAN|nr:uncharacterized protein LOC112047302 isoform X2 [Bicyclus anynana]
MCYENINHVSGNEIDLGPNDFTVNIGSLPQSKPQMTADDAKASYNVRKLLEDLRDSSSTGLYGIPPLDPYTHSKFPTLPISVPYVSGTVDVTDVKLTGLSGIKIAVLEVHLDSVRADLTFTVPLLKGEVNFNAELLLGGLFSMSIEGTLRAELKNIMVECSIGGHLNTSSSEPFYTLSALQAHYHADHMKVSIEGLDIDEDIVEAIESYKSNINLGDLTKTVDSYVSNQVLSQINEIIQKFSAEQVKTYLLDI